MNMKLVLAVIFLIVLGASVVMIKGLRSGTPSTMENENTNTQTSTAQSPTCDGKPTVELTEGPYYLAGSPKSNNLHSSNIPGTKLTLTGYVLDAKCVPIANAWLDFWQADGNGNYDNSGYALRGYQFTDSEGRYTLTTLVPGEYPGRTPHIHVKVGRSPESAITTQLFIPGIANNDNDNIYDKGLLMSIKDSGNEKIATYNFILSN